MKRSLTLWRTGFFNIIFQIAFLVVAYIFGRNASLNLTHPRQVFLDIVIVSIPCAVWCMFFYLQDRIEPEPTRYVLASVFVGMALAKLAGIPLEKTVARIDGWLFTSTGTLILGSVFVVGILHSALFYLGIRYGFYPSKEFDEPVDGPVYGAFIGSGYALVQSTTYLVAHPSMTFFAMTYTATTNTLVYASIAALIGLFVGKAKFSTKPAQLYFAAGVVIGALLAGLYEYLTDFLLVRGDNGGFVASFGFTVVFACAILAVVFWEMRRLTSEPVPQTMRHGDWQPDWAVAAVIVLFAAAGIATWTHAVKGAEFRNERYKISFCHPYALVPSTLDAAIRIMDDSIYAEESTGSSGNFKTLYTVSVRGAEEKADALDPFSFIPAADQPLSIVSRQKMSVTGSPGLRLQYSCLQTRQGLWYPELVLVTTDIVPKDGKTFIFSFRGGRQDFESDLPKYERLLRSVAWN